MMVLRCVSLHEGVLGRGTDVCTNPDPRRTLRYPGQTRAEENILKRNKY